MSAAPLLVLARQPDLFDEPEVRALPDWLAHPVTPLEHQFRAFHTEHPELYQEFERRALALGSAGVKRISIAMLAEAIRYDYALAGRRAANGEEFVVNNSFRAFYARLLVHNHPSLDAKIERRHRRELQVV